MTKRRPPFSPQRALTHIADRVGWERLAEISGKSVRTVMDWSDPDTSAGVSLADAIAFDLEFQSAGGDHAPLHDAYAARLDAEREIRFADAIELSRRTEIVAKETGEATSALIRAARFGATAADKANALREVQEAEIALKETRPLLIDADPADDTRPAGPVPGGAIHHES